MADDADWGYTCDNGPHTWCRRFPTAGGTHQSPVNLDLKHAQFCPQLLENPLTVSYPEIGQWRLENTGFSFKASPGPHTAKISGGPLDVTYELGQLHMHWGSCDSVGSEHPIENRLLPAELHLVHWDSARHTSFDEAASADNGLAVLGIFCEIGEPNCQLGKLLDKFSLIDRPSCSAELTDLSLDLNLLLPKDGVKDYFTYGGSLTTPPCYESVRWILLRTPITVSEHQMHQLRSLKSAKGVSPAGKIVDNYRPPCPLNDRILFTSFEF